MSTDADSGIHLIKRAIELETEKRYVDSLVCYKEGIQALLDFIKDEKDERKRNTYREKICSYIDRAERLKKVVEEQKESFKTHEQININENDTGYSYQKVFSKYFIDETLDYVEINDPYIKVNHQSSVNNQQESRFEEITESLKKRNIELVVKYSTNLHDREIKLSNGRIIKVGRGLDYFKPPEPTGGAMSLGFHDLDLRPCYETTIDVFHKEATKITK